MKKIILLALLAALSLPSAAQKKITDKNAYYGAMHRFESRWLGKDFPLWRQLADMTGHKAFITDKKASMVFIGFAGCIPCKYQLPFLLSYAKKRKDIAFFYISCRPIPMYDL